MMPKAKSKTVWNKKGYAGLTLHNLSQLIDFL